MFVLLEWWGGGGETKSKVGKFFLPPVFGGERGGKTKAGKSMGQNFQLEVSNALFGTK